MAAQGQLQVETVSANGRSGSLKLFPGRNIVVIESSLIAAATTAILHARLGDNGQWEEFKDPQEPTIVAQLNVDCEATVGDDPGWARSFVLEGPGDVSIFVSDYSGSEAIVLKVQSTERR